MAQFRAALLRHGLLHETGVAGIFGRAAGFEAVVDGIDALLGRLWQPQGAERLRFPPGMTRRGFEASGYFRSFPQLPGSVFCFCGDAAEHEALLRCDAADATAHQQPSEVVLTPAACYPVYPIIAARGALPIAGLLVDAASWCFRHEPSLDPARMQMFRQRELVCFGTRQQVEDFRAQWMQVSLGMMEALQLSASADLANDPFYGRTGLLMARGQRSQRLKLEIAVPIADPARPSAVGSCNAHLQHFAEAYGLRLADGSTAFTGCAGFGLERLALALFRAHGCVTAAWPAALRRLLGC